MDKKGNPLRLVISAANEHESRHFIDLVSKISLKGERGRPRTRPIEINADASYDSSEIRQYLRKRGITHPPTTNPTLFPNPF